MGKITTMGKIIVHGLFFDSQCRMLPPGNDYMHTYEVIH